GLKGVLAESWSFNSDCTSLTVELKKGILWHDGTPLTARDVVYSVNTVKSAPDSPYAHLIRYVSAATEVSAYTVKFDLTRSYSQLLYSLYFPIISLNAGDLTSAAVGTGPFMMESYNPGQSLHLVRFEGYRDGNAGFDKIIFSIVKENITAASAFSAGGTNAVQGSVYNADEFTIRDKYEVRRACGSNFEYIGLNHHSPIFSSPTVRGAVSSAIDREELVSESYGDMATAANLPIHPLSLSYSPSASLTDYNAAGAKESLFYDGWTDKYGDGVLSKDFVEYSGNGEDGETAESTAENVRLKFSLLVNGENSRRVTAANIIAAQLGAAGFKVDVIETDFETYISRIESGDYDAYIGGTEIGNLYDLEFLFGTDGSQNYFGYSGEYMDKALAAVAASADEESFANSCAMLQEVFVREQPVVGLAFLDDSLILSKNLAGGTTPLFNSPFGNVGKWFYLK
ncbi:MAG: ABC transporter substrate-binding protein, partial [Clostridia bacterium]